MNEQHTKTEQLIELINPLVKPLGYEVVYLEILTNRQRTLRVFIDFAEDIGQSIGIEDCVKVTRALDEPLDLIPEIEALFKGPYELEISSPGVDRPLRTPADYTRFSGKEVRIHVYRPLSAEELSNSGYQTKNPKQKNFLGVLKGFRENRVLLEIPQNPSGAKSAAKGSGKKAQKKGKAGNGSEKDTALTSTNSAEEVSIPFPLIAKANLEPRFEIDERE